MSQSSCPDRTVPTRRISFGPTLDDVPKHFAGEGDLIASHVLAALSSVFPDGEDFFVASVRRFRDQITDPALKRQVAGFIGQESVHGREHRTLNDRFAQLGYPTKRFERWTRRLNEPVGPELSPTFDLAVTAALEHYTATLAEELLSDPRARAQVGDPRVLDVFLWHAVEENEHKAVAFDVYKAVGGTERERIRAMRLTTVGFIAYMTALTAISLLGDRDTYRWSVLGPSLRRARHLPFFRKELRRAIAEYNRVGFHPDDRDTTALLDEWRERLFGADGALNDLLARPATVAA